MPNVPYKYLKDENWETFYPIIGPSSVNGQIPIANGGTGADTAAGARANLGAVSAHDVTLSSQPNDFILSVSEGGTGANNAADARANLGIGMDLLWTNSNPSESFAAQTIATGDYSGYTMFLVRFKFAKTSTAERKPFICFPNQTTSAQEPNVASSLGGISRDFTFSSSEITCTIASVNTTSSSSTSSDHFIPLYIYGIKL